ncbi:MAG: TolC family protein, partial [Candidatus Eisenbacteria bacterium]
MRPVLNYAVLLFLFVLFVTASPAPSSASSTSEKALPSRPLSVSDCVELALDRNLSVANAKEALNESKGIEIAAVGGLAPRIESSVGVSRRVQGPREYYVPDFDMTFESPRLTSDSYSYSIQATQNLLDLSSWASFRSAHSSVRAAAHSFASARQLATYQVKAQFYELLKATKLLEVSKMALDLSQDELQKA